MPLLHAVHSSGLGIARFECPRELVATVKAEFPKARELGIKDILGVEHVQRLGL